MSAESIAVKRITRESEGDFYRIHCEATGNGRCHCVAWWVPTWEGWSERTAEQNAALRRQLFDAGTHDGYLVHSDGNLAGWVQAWPRDAFTKLTSQFGITSDEDAWMIGCVLVLPAYRGRGAAGSALEQVVADLRLRGARTIDAYPKRGASEPGDMWNGPESTYRRLGFKVVKDDATRPVLRLTL